MKERPAHLLTEPSSQFKIFLFQCSYIVRQGRGGRGEKRRGKRERGRVERWGGGRIWGERRRREGKGREIIKR
jgi:hypothetical protein